MLADEVADRALHELFVRSIADEQSIRDSERGWVAAVARNAALELARSPRSRQVEKSLVDAPCSKPRPEDRVDEPERSEPRTLDELMEWLGELARESLTTRQADIVAAIGSGASRRAVARELGVEAKSIRREMPRIARKLGNLWRERAPVPPL